MGEVDQSKAQVAVLLVPFMAQGHLNQLLHLSRLISSFNNHRNHNIHIHYISTPSHCRQAKLRIHGWNHLNNSTSDIHFHEFSTPPFDSLPPNPNSVSGFPSHLLPSFKASTHLREPVSRLVDSLSSTSKRVVVIYDSLMGSVVQDFVSLHNVESYKFHAVSAFFCLAHDIKLIGVHKNSPIDEDLVRIIPSIDECFPPEFLEFIYTQVNHFESYSGIIYDTCRSVEGRFLDFLEKEENKKHWALGPFNPVDLSTTTEEDENRHELCLEWLDKQSPDSVLYVSFGSTTSMSDEQIMELAIGLEKSKQKFLWVLRDADKGDVFDGDTRKIKLPEGFEKSVEGNGLVLTSWAPQLAILAHSATGGFMSHCGWNSSIESLTMGVPIAAWPMHSDQPMNSVLITHVLKIGLVVRDWASRNQLVTSSMVEDAVKKLMQTEEGSEMRKRATELGVIVRSSVEEGGDAWKEMDSFIAHITR